ncbi:hypothetical protein C9I92_12990 [Photobacterium ganghwense]|uniref:Antibiotic biosynthesis monooxygenase n=1 Tax=Photobacterium ganghwense TaxID=320778 RepID=A0A0J1HIV8_9GAMM|nr:hypothetical protein [Photobacterium ganghwense]KLV11563.1 hypothetical protein ABT57_02190 [Photobacterium ganghwense]PSU08430.1 hypothetical protein C9I92_12990 [Photobacterium ganghwense]QSV15238.1 hypothetical protein FH974_06545 [Photobacterium ganghwense]
MDELTGIERGSLIHIVTLRCKDTDHARQCLELLEQFGKPDALHYRCLSYEFGLREGTTDTVCIVERWQHWQDLDALLQYKVTPALLMYNRLLSRPFDLETDTVRIRLVE